MLFEALEPQMCVFGVLWLLCEALRPQSRRGFTGQSFGVGSSRKGRTGGSKTNTQHQHPAPTPKHPTPTHNHFTVPAFKNTTKIQREDTHRDRKRAKWWREREGKKSEILGGPKEDSQSQMTTTHNNTTQHTTTHNKNGWPNGLAKKG